MASEAQQTQLKLTPGNGGDGVTVTARSEACSLAAANPESSSLTEHLMEQVVELDNLRKAYVRVVSNKGAAGIDGMSVEDLHAWCRDHISELIMSKTVLYMSWISTWRSSLTVSTMIF